MIGSSLKILYIKDPAIQKRFFPFCLSADMGFVAPLPVRECVLYVMWTMYNPCRTTKRLPLMYLETSEGRDGHTHQQWEGMGGKPKLLTRYFSPAAFN